LNDGNRFPYKYDRRHDFSVAMIQRFERVYSRSKKSDIEFSAAWVISSGYCVTLPVAIVDAAHPIIGETAYEMTIQYKIYGERNGYRTAPYHRLDVSATFVRKRKTVEQRTAFSLYNAYNRKNPYYVNVVQDQRGRSRLTQYSMFPILPSISLQFIF